MDRGIALSMDDVLRREVIQRLMCKGELCMREIESRYALEFGNYFATELVALNALAGDGLITSDADAIHVTERGRSLLRTIAMVFDAYLPRAASTQFSKVI